MNPQNDRRIDEQIAKVIEDEVPADVDGRLRSQLADFRERLASADTPNAARSTIAGRRVWRGVVAAAAVIAAVAVIAWNARPQVSLADVAEAVLQQPWLHVTWINEGGETSEVWYSATRDISARRSADRAEYYDHRLRRYDSYDVAEKVLYRVPGRLRGDEDALASMIETVRRLLRNEQLVDDPLKMLEFLGDAREDLKLVSQRLDRVEEDGRRWLDYSLTIRHRDLKDPAEILIRVERETKLPRLVRVRARREGKPLGEDVHIDYPRKGPADVYDLGVPATAKLVDRTPRDDLARIVEANQAGRQRMDDYRALVVQRMESADYAWWMDQPMVIYRKGDKYRVDSAWWEGGLPWIDKPAEDEDMEAWWRKRAEVFRFRPFYITIGSKQHRIRTRNVKDPDGSAHCEVESVEVRDTRSPPGDRVPPYYGVRPEFVCRPPLGVPHEDMEPKIELNPTDGPEGSILLEVRRTGRLGGLPSASHVQRFWLDPARDYAAVRWGMPGGGDPANEEMADVHIIEEMARSPQGVWHATRFRRKSPGPDGETLKQVTNLYIDFDVDLPDSLFQPPKPGRLW